MKKILKVVGPLSIIIFLSFNSFSQAIFTAAQNGNWDAGTTWFGPTGCASGCVEGVDFPGPSDQANTNGFLVIVNRNGLRCKDLLVDVNPTTFSLRFNAPSISLTINGTLLGVDNTTPGFPFGSPPISNVFATPFSWFVFTGTNVGDFNLGLTSEVIAYWSSLSPIFRGTFNLPTGASASPGIIDFIYNGTTFAVDNLVFTNSINIQSGTVYTPSTFAGGINAPSVVIGPNGTLRTSYNGVNQTEGWWYQSSRPSSFSITGTVEYNAGVDQNVFVVPNGYGNLIIEGGGTKTVVGTGGLDVNGNLEIGSSVFFEDNNQPQRIGGDLINNNSTWIPDVNMIFDGTSAQTISGISTLTFDADLIIANTTDSVLGSQNIIMNGTLEVESGAVFNPTGRNITLNSNLIASGILMAGTGGSTVYINDVTACSGSGAAFNNFTINSTGTFTAPAGSTFRVAGAFDNDGTFIANNGTARFIGSADQNITHSTSLEFRNMEIDNSIGAYVNIESDVDLTGNLSLLTTTAQFDADGTSDNGVLTLKSGALNQDAQIGKMEQSNNFRGNVTIERYVDGGPDENTNWRYLTPPITNANVGMWQSVFPVTGNFSNASTSSPETPIDNPAYPSVYFWDATTPPYWWFIGTGASTGATPLENGLGYSVYTYRTSDFTISYRGTIGKGDVPKTVTADAWALLGNPYPATIDWDNLSTTGFYDAFYLRKNDGSYATYEGSSGGTNHPLGGTWDGEISLGQSFWVYSEGATTFTFNESAKTTSPNYQFLREGEPLDLIRIALKRDIQSDEIIIRFDDNTLDEFEPRNDAIKVRNGDYVDSLNRYSYINLSSYIVDSLEDMAISAIPLIEDCDKTVYLKIQDVTPGEHKLSFSNIEAFQMGYNVTLIDKFAGENIEVEENTEYAFQVTSDSSSFGSNRFEVKFSADLIDRSYDSFTDNQCSMSYVNVTIKNAVAGALYEVVKDSETIGDPITAENNEISLKINKEILAVGETVFSLNTSIGSCESFIQDAFIVAYDSIYSITEVEDGITCGPGQVILQASGAPVDGFYRWYENESDTEPLADESQAELVIEDLASNLTYYVAAVNSIGCESTLRTGVKAIVGEIPSGSADVQDATGCSNASAILTASGAPPGGHYVWYDANENVFEGENENTFVTPILTDTTEFYAAIANEHGCAGDKAFIEVPVIQIGQPEITQNGDILEFSITTGNHQWYKDDEIIEGATNPSYDTKNESGYYSIEWIEGTCTIITDKIEHVTGLDDFEESDLIRLFPNPASDQLYVEYNVPSKNKVRLMIYTTEGRMVESNMMDMFTNGHKIVLDIKSYSKGMYITVVYDGENYVYSKFNKK